MLMLTRWGAEYVGKEKELGSIEPGKLADLVVLDRNPLDATAVPDDQISDVKVLATWVGGELKFSDEQFASSHNLPLVGYRGLFSRR
jgi:predicted amidohydrolase YtcJ